MTVTRNRSMSPEFFNKHKTVASDYTLDPAMDSKDYRIESTKITPKNPIERRRVANFSGLILHGNRLLHFDLIPNSTLLMRYKMTTTSTIKDERENFDLFDHIPGAREPKVTTRHQDKSAARSHLQFSATHTR